jgi:FkbM family methyltransferase
VVVEGGGGLGGVTEELLKLECDVTTYEPNFDEYHLLKRKFPEVQVVNGALVSASWPRDRIAFKVVEEPWNSSVLAKLPNWATKVSTVEINACHIDKACRGAKVLVLDVEGYETDLLQGWDYGDLEIIVCEWHEHLRPVEHFERALANLKAHNFQEILRVPSWSWVTKEFSGGWWVVFERLGQHRMHSEDEKLSIDIETTTFSARASDGWTLDAEEGTESEDLTRRIV